MIIDTKEILNLIGLRFTNEGESIIKVAPIRDKISIALIKGRLSTKRLSKNLGLEPRTVRKNLCILEKEGIVKRILGNKINNFVRETDFWELRDKKNVLMSVPKEKIYVSYSTIHTNGGSRIHYFIFPKKVFLTEEFLSALGFFQAEGSKTRQRTIEAVNGEPLLINLFLNFLRYFNVGSEDVAFRVHFNRKILRELKTNKQDLER
ncbi:MAG: DeoR family transcriptional regulator, partial [Candidatus Nanoarchaeia archaeon]